MLDETPVRSDERAVQLNGEGQERSVNDDFGSHSGGHGSNE